MVKDNCRRGGRTSFFAIEVCLIYCLRIEGRGFEELTEDKALKGNNKRQLCWGGLHVQVSVALGQGPNKTKYEG